MAGKIEATECYNLKKAAILLNLHQTTLKKYYEKKLIGGRKESRNYFFQGQHLLDFIDNKKPRYVKKG
ncbi:hypothetical protein AAEX28_07180 [Lentisphaerota bacterium WC36G]|nr:hypothetical protein LJT99_10045 [Lentisphaerae bacterium WC36]